MYPFIALGLILFIFFVIPLGLLYIIRRITKKHGYIKLGKISSVTVVATVVFLFLLTFFEDLFFFKSDAIKLLKEQNIVIKDNFEMIENKSSSIFDDYYKTFTLKISNNDKTVIINDIRQSTNFVGQTQDKKDITSLTNRYFGKKVIQNYEDELQFIREYFEPSGKQNYAPTHRKISIDKKENIIKYEDLE